MVTINFSPSRKSRWFMLTAIIVAVGLGMFVFSQPTSATGLNYSNFIAQGVSLLLLNLLSFLGKFLVVLIDLILQVVQFNNFVQASAVQQGWVVVRDMCNLLLIMVLLAIAWGTVLRIDNYHYRRLLPKFILMAVLINFSKSISGFFIDISQIIMKTFVDAFKDVAASNLTSGVGLEKILQFSQTIGDQQVGFWDTVGAFILGLVLLAMMIGAVLMTLIILLGRIIVLWILVVLSPVAYLGETLTILKKAATMWWKTFGDYLTVGPVLAFFLWLAMSVMSANPGAVGDEIIGKSVGDSSVVETEDRAGLAASISEISRSDNLLSFFLAVGLLYAANAAAQQIKTVGGNMGVKVSKGASSGIMKAPGNAYSWGAKKLRARTGVEANPFNVVRNFRAGMKAKGEQEVRDGNTMAERNLTGNKPWSMLTGASAPGFYGKLAQGLMYRKGISDLAIKPWKDAAAGKNARIQLASSQTQLDQRKEEEKAERDKALAQWQPAQGDLFTRMQQLRKDDPNLSATDAKSIAVQQLREEFSSSEAGEAEAQKSTGYQDAQKKRYEAEAPVRQYQDVLTKLGQKTDFLAQKERNAAVDEAMKEIKTSDPERLLGMFRQALQKKDSVQAEAVARQAATTGNLPKLLQGTMASQNYFEHAKLGLVSAAQLKAMSKPEREKVESELLNGRKPVIAQNTALPDHGLGLQAFVEQTFHKQGYTDKGPLKKVKMNDQTTLKIESDLNELARTKDQYAMTNTVGVRPDGALYHRNRDDYEARVVADRGKRSAENFRKGNASGLFVTEQRDPQRPEAGTRQVVADTGAVELGMNWRQLASVLKKNLPLGGDLAVKLNQESSIAVFNKIKPTLNSQDQGEFQEMLDRLKKYRQPKDISAQLKSWKAQNTAPTAGPAAGQAPNPPNPGP